MKAVIGVVAGLIVGSMGLYLQALNARVTALEHRVIIIRVVPQVPTSTEDMPQVKMNLDRHYRYHS